MKLHTSSGGLLRGGDFCCREDSKGLKDILSIMALKERLQQ
jgi:hypothetical protein